MNTILKAENITKIYGSKNNPTLALDQFSFEVHQGEFLGIMGPSGSGKSTLLNVISTIDLPTTGRIFVDQVEIATLKKKNLADFRREKLGFIFQDFNLLDTLTVKENILLPLAIGNVPPLEIRTRVELASKLLDITDILHKYPSEISGGQKQRTAAARAMINRPKMILADEPTGALDSKSSQRLLESMQDLNRSQNATILMVTHDPYAASYCDRIIFIKDGKHFTEIYSDGVRKTFYNRIIATLGALGGGINDLL